MSVSINISCAVVYCKTLYFSCILSWRFSGVAMSLQFNLAFSQCTLQGKVTSDF